MKGVPHYTKAGKRYTGPTHKMGGELHTGAKHSARSQKLYHRKPRGK